MKNQEKNELIKKMIELYGENSEIVKGFINLAFISNDMDALEAIVKANMDYSEKKLYKGRNEYAGSSNINE